jgi:serine/threonine-protein kinase
LENIGDYRIVTRLGSGAMTETYEAVREGAAGVERRARVQWLFPSYAQDEKVRALVIAEAQMAMSLRHRGIVSAIDFGEHEGSFFLVFDYVDGVSLEELLQKWHGAGQKLPTHLAVLIATDVSEALNHAHGVAGPDGSPVYHRDICPERILISRAGEVLLTGFGLGGALQKSESTRSHFVRSNAWYMSPEQVSEKPVDGRADLYSFGCVLFEILAGRRAFQAGSDLEAMLKVSKGERPALQDLAKEASSEVIKLVESLLERRPDDRPASAADVFRAFSAIKPPVTARRELAESVATAMGAAGPALSNPSYPPTVPEAHPPSSMEPGPPETSAPVTPPMNVIDRAPVAGSPSALKTAEVDTRPKLDLAVHEPATIEMAPLDADRATTRRDEIEPPTAAFTPLADAFSPPAAMVAGLDAPAVDAEPPTAPFVPKEKLAAIMAPQVQLPGAGGAPPPPPGAAAFSGPVAAPMYGAPPPAGWDRGGAVPIKRTHPNLKYLLVGMVVLTVILVATMIGVRSCGTNTPPPPPASSSS